MSLKLLSLITLCILYSTVEPSRILGIFPMASPSHDIVGKALMRGLAEAGHDVTIISPYEEKEPPKGSSYRNVILTGFAEKYEELMKHINLLEQKNQTIFELIYMFVNITTEITEGFFSNKNVQNFLKSNQIFDVVIVEQFFNDGMKIFGHIYNAPVITFITKGPTPWVNNAVGNPSPLSYVTRVQGTFSDRFRNLALYLFGRALDYFFYFPKQDRILKKYFTDPPNIYDLFYNVSLVLLNSHESLNQPVPLVPNMVEIGGFHVKPPKKLPEDLQEYLDNAKEGVVYFSLGSNLRSKNLPPYKRDAFLKAFGKLKEKVLWKWEEENLPGKPPNVKTYKWFPQNDILAHPNVKLFITHCGLLSTTESVYHGVPILAIPVFGDQHQNAEIATSSGFALSLPYEDPSFSEEKLSELLQELLTNTQYTNNVKKRSQLFHDRPLKPMESAVYWVEYVIRTKGAYHLGVAGVKLPWIVYHSLDVISFIIALTSLIVYLLYLSIRKIVTCRRTSHKQKNKSKIN